MPGFFTVGCAVLSVMSLLWAAGYWIAFVVTADSKHAVRAIEETAGTVLFGLMYLRYTAAP